MRLIVFDDYRIGVLKDSGVVDVSRVVPGWQPGDLHAMNRLIAGWDSLGPTLEEASSQALARSLEQVRLRAPVPAPTHLFGAPANYRAHVAEMRQQGFGAIGGGESAETLGFFLKATGSISGPQDPITLPIGAYPNRRFDHEGELAFVVGREATAVAPEDALRCIFGYTMMVDVTLRGSSERTEERVQRKSFATFSPMGPCVTTADEIRDPNDLHVRLWLNDELKQDAHLMDMIVDVPNLLSRASHVLPLRPGDVYTTGSPPGVGRIVPGDTIVVECGSIGRMTLSVQARAW